MLQRKPVSFVIFFESYTHRFPKKLLSTMTTSTLCIYRPIQFNISTPNTQRWIFTLCVTKLLPVNFVFFMSLLLFVCIHFYQRDSNVSFYGFQIQFGCALDPPLKLKGRAGVYVFIIFSIAHIYLCILQLDQWSLIYFVYIHVINRNLIMENHNLSHTQSFQHNLTLGPIHCQLMYKKER